MAKTQILEYTIYFDDKEIVDRLNAAIATGVPTAETGTLIAYPGHTKWGIFRAPDTAAVEFATLAGAVPFGIIDAGEPIPAHDGGYITGEWFTPSNSFDRTVPFFVKDGGWWIFGEDTKFYWVAQVAWAPPAPGAVPASGANEPTEPAEIPVRYGIQTGQFEQSIASQGTTPAETNAASSLKNSRVSSRLGGGLGWNFYSDAASVQNLQYNHVTSTDGRWERFYIRCPEAPDVMTHIWYGQHGGGSSGSGYGLAITPQLQIAFLNYSSTGVFSLEGTVADLDENAWYKVDIIFHVDAVGNTATIEIFLNGQSVATSSRVPGGVQGNRVLTSSSLGDHTSTAHKSTFHFDSWILAAIPVTRDPDVLAYNPATTYAQGNYVRSGSATYIALQGSTGKSPGVEDPDDDGSHWPYWRKLTDPVDFQQGSHVQYVAPTAFSANHGAWTGDVRLLTQRGDVSTRSTITSTTSGALIAADVDLERDVESIPGAVGWVAAQVNCLSLRGSTGSGQVGYLVGSASAAVETNVTQGSSLQWNAVVYSPTGLTEPMIGETLEIRHRKAADTSNGQCAVLGAAVEVIGRFGPEDDLVSASSGSSASSSAPAAPSNRDDRYPNGIHNAQYPYSPWHLDRGALGPVIVKGGTYVGNALAVTLSFPVPPVFIWIRRTASDPGASVFYPTLYDGHAKGQAGNGITGIARLEQDFDFVDSDPDADQQMSFDVHIAGNDTAFNANGSTYQYIAFCDPAARFSRAGCVIGNDIMAPFTHHIDDPEFQPEILFAMQETLGSSSTVTQHMQGPGHSAGVMQILSTSTSISDAITIGEGTLTIGDNWVSTTFHQYGYLGFRRHDGNDHPDEAKVMFLGSYTGDGSASRTINLAPATGFRPLWAVVQPLNGQSHYRDPTHTTNTSSPFTGGATVTTGITAGGIDSFTVGSTLNSNGIVYNYFGFYADATAGNGGWGGNGTYAPVPADSPFPSDWSEPEEIPFGGASSSAAPGPPPEQPDLDETTALPNTSLFCLDYSTRICNRALGRIGVSKQIADLATDQTEQAVVARLHLKDDVEATLRLFPWAFATEYATLVLHSGDDSDPVNADWQYAYTAPVDCVFARRIVPQSGHRRKYDANPIVFRLGLDEGDGALIFCNERTSAEVPLVLEYTKRVGCPAYFGDALFREALVWKVASSFAAALAKDATKAEFCLRAWEAFRGKAETAAANEQQAEQGTTNPDAAWTRGRGDADWISGRE